MESRSADAGTSHVTLADLLDDFSPKRARKFTDTLPPDQIKSLLTQLLAKPKDSANSQMRAELVRALARLNAQEAWTAVLAMPDGSERTRLLGAIAGELAKTNPKAAIDLAISLPPGSRKTVLTDVFRDWVKISPETAMAYLKQHPETPTDTFTVGTMLSELTTTNPQLAAKLALSFNGSDLYTLPISTVMERWIDADVSQARRWLDSLTDPRERDLALRAFAGARALRNPKLALELAGQISSSQDRLDVQRKILGNWLNSDGAAAIDYIVGLGEGASDQSIRSWLGFEMGNMTSDEQSRLLTRMPNGKMKDEMIGSLVRRNSSTGRYAQAAALLNVMQDSRDRDMALHNLAVGWAKADAKSFVPWLNQQSDSSDKDLIVSGYCSTMAATDPQAAIKMAGSIPDKSVQKTTLKNILTCWMIADRAGAQAWLEADTSFTKSDRDMITMMAKYGRFLPTPPTVAQKR